METIFDCFFEEKLQSLTRCGLKTRQNRIDVIDHLNAVLAGCCDGQNMAPEDACQLAIVAAINYHKRNKRDNSTICLMGKYHNVLYVALKVAWDWGVKDNGTITLLLEEIYSCEKTFERLFLGAIFGTNAPHFIAGWKSDFKDQDENCRAMVYYLEHATRSGVTFPVMVHPDGGLGTADSAPIMMRFIDVPIESCGRASPLRVALQASAPDILLILLRFGASALPIDGGSNPIISLMDKLAECYDRRYPFQLVACLQMLVHEVPMVEMPYKPFVYQTRREMFAEKYGVLLADGLIARCNVFGVPDLKSLIRSVIRERLRQNSQLPQGIKQLAVPRRLRRFIDLMADE